MILALLAVYLTLAATPTGKNSCPKFCTFILSPVCANRTSDGVLKTFPNNCSLASENECPQNNLPS